MSLSEGPDAARPSDEVSHGETLHEDDEHEVTTLEGGSEERIAPARKQRVDDEGEAVEQIGGDALEEFPAARRACAVNTKFRKSSSADRCC